MFHSEKASGSVLNCLRKVFEEIIDQRAAEIKGQAKYELKVEKVDCSQTRLPVNFGKWSVRKPTPISPE